MINCLEFESFLRSFKQNLDSPFAFLLGAGASISSGIQTAKDCIWDWKKQIFLSHNPSFESYLNINVESCRRTIQQWIDNQGIYPKENSEEEYEFYAEKTYPISEDRRRYFEKLSYDKQPNIGYKLLLLMFKYGVLKSVWSTNFDGLVPRCAHQFNLTPIEITLDNPELIYRLESSKELPYIALHGDYKYSKLKNTSRELDAQEELFASTLGRYFVDRNLIVIGYSGRDKSLMHSLKDAFTKSGAGRLYWCGYGMCESPEVKELISSINESGREAFYVNTRGFDETMISLLLSTYRDDIEKYTEIQTLLKEMSVEEEISPFSVGNRTEIIGCAKSNLLPITFPSDIFQFEINYPKHIEPREYIETMIKNHEIIAGCYKDKVFAFGLSDDISRVFKGRLKGNLVRVPLFIPEIKQNSVLRSVVLTALIIAMSKSLNMPSDKSKRIIWNPTSSYSAYNDIFEAVKVDLLFTENEKYAFLSLEPTLYFENKNKYTKEKYNSIIRSYIDKLRNKPYDSILEKWKDRITDGLPKKMYCISNGENQAFFKTSGDFALMSISGLKETEDIKTLFTDKRILFNGILIPEPELVFSSQYSEDFKFDCNPMRGLKNFSPYDFPLYKSFYNLVNLGVICPSLLSNKAYGFLKQLNATPDLAGTISDYIQQYNGFENIYSCPLSIPEIDSENWIPCRMQQDDTIKLARNICQYAERMSAKNPGLVIVIFIPNLWQKHRNFKLNGEEFDLHNYIKAYAVRKGFTTQIIEEKTIDDSKMRTEILWWLSLALFVKSMRTPWILKSLDDETAYAGIGYSLRKSSLGKVSVVIGSSHIYNSKGQGLRYSLAKIDNPILDRKNNPYLTYEEAYKLGVNVSTLFIKSMNTLPKRVVIHKRTPFRKEEIRGIRDALAQVKIYNVDLVTIEVENKVRCIDYTLKNSNLNVGNFPIHRGVCIPISKDRFLLWSHGAIQSINDGRLYYAGGRGIPYPLKVTKYYGTGSMQTIAKEILGFTKMNWNSFNYYTKLPATIDTSSTVAQIGRLIGNFNGIKYDYRYFI